MLAGPLSYLLARMGRADEAREVLGMLRELGRAAFEAENEGDARAVVAADPAVVSRVFVAELHPWRLVDWERYVKK